MPRGIKYFILYLIGLPLLLLTALIEGDMRPEELTDFNSMALMVILYHVMWALILYFGILNRRRFIVLSAWKSVEPSLRSIGAITATVGFVVFWFFSIFIAFAFFSPSVWILAVWVFILFIGIYFLCYRGICIYENGKLRVFQGRITTIRDGWVDEMSIEKHPNHDVLNLRVGSRVFRFKLPADEALSAADRIKAKLDDIADFGFCDEE